MPKKILFAFLGLVIIGALATTSYFIFNQGAARPSAEGGPGERGIAITPRSAKAFLTDPDIERWAVVVGISDYKNNPAVTDLKYADRDAQSFYDFLVSPQGGCFKTENIQLLLNQKATVSNLRSALGTFLGKTADKDLVVIYMAGHGAPDPKKWENLYFLTHDADLDSLPNTAYPMDDLTRDLQRYIKAKKVIVITDACHSAAVSGGMIAMRGNEGYRVNDYLKKLAESREGCTFITASRAGEGSQESEKWGSGHGVFTHFLLEGLKGKADRNGDGFITMKEAYDYLYPKVQRESENGQAPFASAYLDNSIPIGICEPEKIGLTSRPVSQLPPTPVTQAPPKETVDIVELANYYLSLTDVSGREYEARHAYSLALQTNLPKEKSTEIKGRLIELNKKLVFSSFPTPDSTIYTVKAGDNITNISQKYNVETGMGDIALGHIRRINGLKTRNIFSNDILKILTGQIWVHISKTNLTMTLYINDDFIKEYRISVGDPTRNCDTPVGTYTIGTKTIHPTWYKKTDDGRKEEVPYGDTRNVLGTRWMAFRETPSLGIHGTTMPETIGKKISNGSVRMYNADVEEVYDLISKGAKIVVEE
ncbi:MAG: L,D-transpeptidase family protein [Planctomycetota bacterium]